MCHVGRNYKGTEDISSVFGTATQGRKSSGERIGQDNRGREGKEVSWERQAAETWKGGKETTCERGHVYKKTSSSRKA